METIHGTVEVLGDSESSSGGRQYSYIRFLKSDGSVSMIDKTIVGNGVDSYLRPGAHGRFLLFRKFGRGFLIAYQSEERTIDDTGIFKKEIRKMILLSISLFIVGLVLSVIIIGIPIALGALALIFIASSLNRALPSREKIELWSEGKAYG